MKKSILTIALAFGIAIPMFATSTPVAAEEYVEARRDNTSLVRMMTATHGQTDCQIPKGTRLKVIGRDRSVLYVNVLEPVGNQILGYCIPGREYYVRRNYVVSVQSDGASGASGASGQQENTQQVFTGGRWGNEVPVFRTRGAYYSARKSQDREGHYNGQRNQLECTLRVGTGVEFEPYRDWGTGQVRFGNCSGWTDRAVIR